MNVVLSPRLRAWLAVVGTDPAIDQHDAAWYEDDNSNVNSNTVISSGATSISRSKGIANQVVLRIALDEHGGKNGSEDFELWVSRNSGAYTQVTTTHTYVRTYTSALFTDGAACTQRLGNGSTGSYINGQADKVNSIISAFVYGKDDYWEHCFAIYFTDSCATSDTYDFQIRSTYTNSWGTTPRVTILATTHSGAATLNGVGGISAAGSYEPQVALALSDYIAASGENTTGQLTAPSGKSVTADFGGGRIQDDENPADAVDPDTDEYLEYEWCLEGTSFAKATTYEFRLEIDGVAVTYTATPTLTVTTAVIESGAAVLAGAGGIAASAVATKVGASALAGVGTLAAAAACTRPGAAALAGTGTLAAVGDVSIAGTATLAGTGTLTADAVCTRGCAAALAGVGTLAAAAQAVRPGAAVLAGVGDISAAATTATVQSGAATLDGAGTLVANGTITAVSTAALAGVGTLVAVGVRTRTSATNLPGVGTLAAAAVRDKAFAALLAGVGTLAAAAVRVKAFAASLAGTGTLAANATKVAVGAATLPGVGGISASGDTAISGAAALDGIGTLVAASSVTKVAATALPGVGTMVASAAATKVAAAAGAGVGTLSAAGTIVVPAAATLSGVGGISATGEAGAFVSGAATLNGVGGIAANATNTYEAAVTLNGVGTINAVCAVSVPAAAALAGAGTLSAVPDITRNAVALLAGTGGISATALDVVQYGFRWRDDDGNETGASWLAGQNVQVSRAKLANTRLRVGINTTGNLASKQATLKYRKKGSGDPWEIVRVSN